MQDDQVDENLLFTSDGMLYHVRRSVENARQSWVTIEVRPNVPVILGDCEQIGDAACFGLGANSGSSKEKAADHAHGIQELACRSSGRVRLVFGDDLSLSEATNRQREPFRWNVTLSNRQKLGLIPDQVFALEFTDQPPGRNRAFFFLEADRATMPVVRQNLSQTSFYRKLLAYEATWTQGLHRSRFGFHRFRVLTVTSSPRRVESIVAACQNLERGHGLFLFADRHSLAQTDPLAYDWKAGRPNETARLLDS